MKNILVPIDFSEQSVSAFRFALDIAAKSNAQVELLHIISLPALHDSPVSIGGFRKPLIDEFKEIAHQKFSRLIARFYRERTKVKTHVIIGNHIHHIISQAEVETHKCYHCGLAYYSKIKSGTIKYNTHEIYHR